jgi:hypothetical protein
MSFGLVEIMNDYFVAGGLFTNLESEERFDLVCPGPGEPPYVLVDGIMDYFRLIWQSAHLYRVEDDWSLSLVAPSAEALQLGIQAPEKVWLNENMLKKLQAAVRPYNPTATLKEDGPSECFGQNDKRNVSR